MFVETPNFWTDSQYNQQDNGFEKGPVPQLGWGRGINRCTQGQRLNGFEKVQQAVEF